MTVESSRRLKALLKAEWHLPACSDGIFRRFRKCVLSGIALTLVLFSSAKAASNQDSPAQQDEPSPDSESEPSDEAESRIRPGVLHLTTSEMFLDLEASYEQRRVRSAGERRPDTVQRNQDFRLEQALTLRLGGDIVDPNLIRWNAEFSVGLAQEDSREKTRYYDRSDYDSGLLLEYDLSLDILPSKPISGSVYARQERNRIPRRFLSSLIEDRSEAGASVFARLGSWTSEVGVEWSDVDRTGNRNHADDEHLTTARAFIDNRWEISDKHRLRIAYDHERVESDYQGSRYTFNTTRDQLRIEHDLAFGSAGQHRLDTYFRWNNEQGDIPRDELEFTPRLTLKHSDAFETIYRYSYYRIEQDAIELNRHKVDFDAIWKPNDRWRISADTYALRERAEQDVEVHEFGGGIDASNRRPTRWGEFSANASLTGDEVRTLGDAGDRLIRGESHVLDSARPTFLRQPDIKRHTIRAYSVDRTRLFVEGRDYLVLRVGRLTSVYRLLTGRIADGDAVVFDYRYRIPAGSVVDTYRTDLRLEHEFRFGLTPYYAFEDRRQNADRSRGTPAFADDSERHRFGLRYVRSNWSINGEFEDYDDSVEPYRAYRLDAQATLLQSPIHTMDAAVNLSHYDFVGDFDSRRVNWIDVSLTNNLQLDPYWSALLKSAYRWEDNSRDGETDGVDLECGVRFQRGRLGVDLTVEYNLLKIREDRDEGFGVWLHLRRDLSHLLASATRSEDGWRSR